MSIVAYTGLPGSGKSYGVVENVVLPAIKQNRAIITNIPLNIDELETAGYSPNITPFNFDTFNSSEGLDLQALADFLNDESFFGAVFILDEVQIVLPSGLMVNKIPKDLNEFFSKHRHRVGQSGYSSEIIYITQNQAQISAFLRNLTELTFNTNKQGLIGLKNRYSVFAYSGAKTETSKHYQKFRGKYKKQVYRFYQSHTQNKSFDFTSGLEQIQDKRTTIWTPKFFILMSLCVIAFLFSFYKTKQYFLGDQVETKKPIENSVNQTNLKNQLQNQNNNISAKELKKNKISTKERLLNSFGQGQLYIELMTTKLGNFSFFYETQKKDKIYISPNSMIAFADKISFLDICLAKTNDDYIITCPPAPKSQIKTQESSQDNLDFMQVNQSKIDTPRQIIEPFDPFN